MDQNKHEAILVILIPQIISLICEDTGADEITATDKFYSSKVYALLEREDTKLWHLSPLTLFNMFDEEQHTGAFTIPEEV